MGEGNAAGGGRIRVAAVLDTWIVSGPGRQLAALSKALEPLGVDLVIVMFQRAGRAPSPFIPYLQAQNVRHAVVSDGGRLDFGVARQIAQRQDG